MFEGSMGSSFTDTVKVFSSPWGNIGALAFGNESIFSLPNSVYGAFFYIFALAFSLGNLSKDPLALLAIVGASSLSLVLSQKIPFSL
jgi:hypothetical protein